MLHASCTDCNVLQATLRRRCKFLIKQLPSEDEGATISRNIRQCLTIAMAEHSRTLQHSSGRLLDSMQVHVSANIHWLTAGLLTPDVWRESSAECAVGASGTSTAFSGMSARCREVSGSHSGPAEASCTARRLLSTLRLVSAVPRSPCFLFATCDLSLYVHHHTACRYTKSTSIHLHWLRTADWLTLLLIYLLNVRITSSINILYPFTCLLTHRVIHELWTLL
jgi:hypothetical protein